MEEKNKKIDYEVLLNNLLEEIPQNVYFKDRESKFLKISKSMICYFDLKNADDIIGKKDSDFFTAVHAEKARQDEIEIIETGIPRINIEEEETWPDGRITVGLTSKMPLFDKNKNIIGTFGITRDITERKRLEMELKRLTNIDSLTGLANRRHFSDLLKQEWNRSLRNKFNLSILMIDVDHFKLFNDNYGHISGDNCLKKISKAFKASVERKVDLIARYGGEEFVIILPQTDMEGAKKVANKIHKNIKRLEITHESSPVDALVTVSIGISSTIPQKGEKALNLISNSDAALYEAKQAGRNRTCIYNKKN